MEYLITAYPSTPTPAMILTPPARAYSPSPSPSPAPEPEQEPIASTSKLGTSRRVLDHILLPRLPAGWLSAPPAARASEPVQDAKACHQCRNLKNPHPRFRCGRAGCLRAFCSGCLARRYGWTPQDVHARGCPDCRGVCNCSRCLDRAGLGKHKAFLTADARGGGCARKWLAERGLLVEGSAPQPKKNTARRPRILAKPEGAPKKKVKKTQARPVEYDYDYDEDEPRSRGRWIIDASAKLVKRWARERAVRGAQVRAGTRRWFVGASPPPRARARDATAEPLLVETIDLTLDDDDDAPDSLFDAKSTDGDAQPARDDRAEDADEKIADDVRARDSPDSLFDEKTEDEDAPAQHDAHPMTDAPAQTDALEQNAAPDDKDDDKDSLFDGDPGTPAAPSPPQIAPAPIQLPSTPPQLPPTPTPIHLPPSPPFQLPPAPSQLPPTPVQPAPTPVQLPPASPIVSLSRSDSYTDALRIDVELGVASSAPGSPAKGAVEVHITFGDAFGGASTAALPPVTSIPDPAPAAARSPVTVDLAPAPPKSPPKTFSKAASAMFIPRAKPVAKRKRSDEDETRLESAKSSAGVLVALGRPGRKRVREEEALGVLGEDTAAAMDLMDDVPEPPQSEVSPKDDAPAPPPKDDVGLHASAKVDEPVQNDGAPAHKDDAAGKKRPREHDASTMDDARPTKRAALSKETARKPRPDTSPEREGDYDVDDEPRAAPSKQTARASSSRHEDSTIVDGLPTPKPTHTKHSAADALAQAMRAAYGGGASASTSDPHSSASTSAPVAPSSSAPAASSSSTPAPAKRSKPTVLAQRASLAIALKTPAPPAPSAASALAAAYKQAYAARPASPASTLRSSPTPEPSQPTMEHDGDGRSSKPALHDELSTFIGRFDDNDKDDEEPTPELLPSDLAAQSEGSSRTGPVSPLVAAHRRPPTILTIDTDEEQEEEMPARRPFVPCNPRRFVGMPLRFVPAPKRPRPRQVVIDMDTEEEDEQDFGLARRRKRTKLWEQSALVLQQQEAIVVLDDSDDSDFQPSLAVNKGTGKGKGKAKSFGPGKGKSFGPGKGKGKTKPPPRKLPLSSFIAYSYTPPPPEPEEPQEPVFVPDDDTAAAPPASEVWLGAAMAPLSPDLGLTRAVADAWFSAV